MIAAVALLWAGALVLATGGSLRRLSEIELSGGARIVVLFLLQGLLNAREMGQGGFGEWSVVLWASICALLVLQVLASVRTAPGLAIVATGLMLNLLVVLLNEGMPFLSDGGTGASGLAFYHRGGQGTILPWLADIVPVPGGLLVSAGDVLLVTGVVSVVVRASTKRFAGNVTDTSK